VSREITEMASRRQFGGRNASALPRAATFLTLREKRVALCAEDGGPD